MTSGNVFLDGQRVQWRDGSRYRTGLLISGRLESAADDQLVDVRDDELDAVVQVRARLLEPLD
ncbi:hypothetical protein [Mycolicibacterium sp.]|uniref:hypothetical protein n=1 Tax=Mycolicibacterium sp. TaxID=2320850 RepID=UPI00355E452C